MLLRPLLALLAVGSAQCAVIGIDFGSRFLKVRRGHFFLLLACSRELPLSPCSNRKLRWPPRRKVKMPRVFSKQRRRNS